MDAIIRTLAAALPWQEADGTYYFELTRDAAAIIWLTISQGGEVGVTSQPTR